MGVIITGKVKDTTVTLTHEPSKATLITTPPVDNQGDGSSFSPTDLFATSLAACTTTIVALYAKNHNITIDKMECRVEKHMQVAPRRVAKLDLLVQIKSSCSDQEWLKLQAAGKACPVRLSIHPEVIIEEVYQRI